MLFSGNSISQTMALVQEEAKWTQLKAVGWIFFNTILYIPLNFYFLINKGAFKEISFRDLFVKKKVFAILIKPKVPL